MDAKVIKWRTFSITGPGILGHVHCHRCYLVTELYLTLRDPMDCSPPGSSVHRIFQTRILEWIAISSPGDLPDPGIKPTSPASLADSLPLSHHGSPQLNVYNVPSQKKKRRTLAIYSTSYTKINWQWIIDLNVMPKTIKNFMGKHGRNFFPNHR